MRKNFYLEAFSAEAREIWWDGKGGMILNSSLPIIHRIEDLASRKAEPYPPNSPPAIAGSGDPSYLHNLALIENEELEKWT